MTSDGEHAEVHVPIGPGAWTGATTAGSADLLPAEPFPTRRRRAPLLAAGGVLVAAALTGGGVLVASGGHHRSAQLAGTDPLALAREAANKVTALGSSKVDVTMSFSAGGRELQGAGSGVFDYRGGKGTLSITIDPVGTMNEVLTRTGIYLELPESERAAMSSVTKGKPWIELSFAAMQRETGIDVRGLMQQSGGEDPASALRLLSQGADFRVVGTEAVRGVATTHYSGTVDVAAVLRKQSSDPVATETALAQLGSTHVPVEMWVDSNGVPRRMAQTITSKQTGAMRMVIDFYDFGAPVAVTVPPPDEVVDAASLTGG